ncbi:DUF6331 family protein [uncultured Arcticibacterium sp.]|uniref:DUF6331 family protein n=1 Tax=uncultured Arcticibacterium sp. TaxID=2173042 RepID=UPI0030F95162
MKEGEYLNIVSDIHEIDIIDLFQSLKSQHMIEGEDFKIKHNIADLKKNKIFHLEFPMNFNGGNLNDIIKSEEQWVDKTNLDNIHLGNENYIIWKDVDWASEPRLNIDKLIQPITPIFNGLESICMRMCCGIHAFDFTIENIKQLKNLDYEFLKSELNRVIQEVEEINELAVSSSILNQSFEKTVFLKLLNHLKSNLS